MNYIKKISIEHYKGFFEEQSLEFGIPDGEHDGSGLTVIVGPNNTGKTSVIESILIQTREENGGYEIKFPYGERHQGYAPKITITFIRNDGGVDNVVYTNVDNGSQVKKLDNSKSHDILFDVIQSRRYWYSKTSNTYDENAFRRSSRNSSLRNSSGVDTAAILKTINNSADKKIIFNGLLKRIINVTSRTIDTNDDNQDFIDYTTGSGISHQSGLLGDGVISIFRICAQLINVDNTTIIIDEPELSLHPQSQKKLAKVLSEKARDRQIILCTHSPYFISREDFLNGAKFVRLNKYNDVKCTIHQLGIPQNYLITEGSLNSYQQPEFLDIVSKEVMFSEKICFVEGKEDVGLIKKFIKEFKTELNGEIDFDIFGYGSGGRSRIEKFLKMAQDMGIKKVGAIYDGDVDEQYINEKINLFPNFKILRLNTSDIRDKNKRITYNSNGDPIDIQEAKEGIFFEDGDIKEDKKDYFKDILQDLINYYNS